MKKKLLNSVLFVASICSELGPISLGLGWHSAKLSDPWIALMYMAVSLTVRSVWVDLHNVFLSGVPRSKRRCATLLRTETLFSISKRRTSTPNSHNMLAPMWKASRGLARHAALNVESHRQRQTRSGDRSATVKVLH